MELARVTKAKCFNSLMIKTSTSYKGTLKNPGREWVFDHSIISLTNGKAKTQA